MSVLGVIALALAATTDAAGALLGVVAGVGLLAFAAVDAIVRPRLAADAAGLSVRSPSYRVRLDWSDIDRLQGRRAEPVRRTGPDLGDRRGRDTPAARAGTRSGPTRATCTPPCWAFAACRAPGTRAN